MKSLSQMFGLETVQQLSEMSIPIGEPISQKITPTLPRVDLEDLERVYMDDPIVFNGVNKTVEVIMSGGYKLQGNEKSVAFITEFLDSVGKRGGSTEWNTMLYSIFQHQCIYGRAFNELIYDKGKIADLDMIDPKYMDYAKSSKQYSNIALDKYGNPIGYIQKLPVISYTMDLKSDPVPEGIYKGANQIFLEPDKIAQYKLFTVGDGFYGVGLVEPIYRTSLRKLRLTEALTNLYLQLGPRQIAKVGDMMHEPTNELVRRTLEELYKARYNSVFAIPYYVDLSIIEPKHPEKFQDELAYLNKEETTVLGPEAFVTGSGEATNRSTLNRQEAIYKLTLKDIIRRTTRCIETEIFARLAKQYKLPGIPRIVWDEIDLEELDSKAGRLVKYVDSGVIKTDDDLEQYVRQLEELPKANPSPLREPIPRPAPIQKPIKVE